MDRDVHQATPSVGFGENQVSRPSRTRPTPTARRRNVRPSMGLSGDQFSALLGAMHRANGLVLVPEEVTVVPAGSPVTRIRLDIEEGTVLAAGR